MLVPVSLHRSTTARLAAWTNSSTKSGRSGWWWRCAWESFRWGKFGNIRIRCPLLTVVAFCFLPASLNFIRQEGGTIPMVFFASLTALLIVKAISGADEFYLAAAILAVAGCAMSKFEGIVYAAVWFCVLLPFCWRRGWLKKTILWKSAPGRHHLFAAICLVSTRQARSSSRIRLVARRDRGPRL